MLGYRMGNTYTFRILLFSVALCGLAWCSAIGHCEAQEANGNRQVASLHEIRVKSLQDSKEDEVQVDLLLSNHSDAAYCVLPTQFSLGYSIQYRNGEVDFVAGGRSTASTGAKGLDDLELPSVVIEPGHAAIVQVTLKTAAKPRGDVGKLELSFQCIPAYKGDRYRGVLLYRDPIRIQSEVRGEYNVYTRQWVIRSLPGNVNEPRMDAKERE